jgi:hypothetical protein
MENGKGKGKKEKEKRRNSRFLSSFIVSFSFYLLVVNPLALMRGHPRVLVIGHGALLLDEYSSPACRLDG